MVVVALGGGEAKKEGDSERVGGSVVGSVGWQRSSRSYRCQLRQEEKEEWWLVERKRFRQEEEEIRENRGKKKEKREKRENRKGRKEK